MKDDKFYKKQLIERGWNSTLIDKLLPKPKEVKNNYYGYTLLWNKGDVLKAEENEEFKERYAKFIATKKKKEENKNKKILEISKEISINNPALDYPNARKMKRHFILNVGDTNTGKTYNAIKALKDAQTGVYLAPLRLLALEIQESLNNEGYPCNLLTGEEEDIVENARYISSTVEKVNLLEKYEIGIIDECQMIEDDFRGGAWTRAILGLCAETIYLCMSESAVEITTKLIELCDDTYEINRYERTTPLNVEYKRIKVENLERGDAIIVFSRRKVHEYVQDLEMFGYNCSVIYGSLPYSSRRYQMERYRNGETDILIATDAIGMGLNLPIRRVLFGASTKFDGIMNRPLTTQEVRQISGRAGRKGIYDEGIVSAFEFGDANLGHIGYGISAPLTSIKMAKIPFPESCIKDGLKISESIKLWNEVEYPDIFTHESTADLLEKIKYLEKHHPDLDKHIMFKMATVMFDIKNQDLYNSWCGYIKRWVNGKNISMPGVKYHTLDSLEDYYKSLDLYYSFCKSLNIVFDKELLDEKREEVFSEINKLLTPKEKKSGKCSRCGQEYKKTGTINVCDRCKKRIKDSYKERRYDWY